MAEPRDSYSRCLVSPGFLDRFYEIFLSSDPAIRAMFLRTDFDRQKALLRHMLTILVMYDSGNELADQGLARMAQVHGPDGLDVPKHLYDRWADCLVQSVQESDPEFDSGVEAAWRETIARSVEGIFAHRT